MVDSDEAQALRSLWEAGRAAWPGVPLDEAELGRHVLAHAAAAEDRRAYLRRAQGDGLYLCCACALGVPEAMAALEARYLAQVPQLIGRLRPSDDLIEEVKQRLRIKLLPLTPRGGAAAAPAEGARGGLQGGKIGEYSGEGTLGSWLRVVALREALSLLRRRGELPLPEREQRGDDALLGQDGDPELRLMKERYREDFQQAFQDALRALSAEQRNLLRLHFVDGMNIDQFGAMFQVHRATAARWLQAAREAIFDETRRLLGERLRLRPQELDSVIRLVRSQLDVSIARILKE